MHSGTHWADWDAQIPDRGTCLDVFGREDDHCDDEGNHEHDDDGYDKLLDSGHVKLLKRAKILFIIAETGILIAQKCHFCAEIGIFNRFCVQNLSFLLWNTQVLYMNKIDLLKKLIDLFSKLFFSNQDFYYLCL